MRLFICADIEGVAGVVSWDQTRSSGFEFDSARRWMTAEVRAVCETALEAGYDEVIVADAHGSAQNLLIDLLPERVRVVRGWPRPLGMMQGVDRENVNAAILLGHHTGAAAPGGQLAHTMSGAAFWDVRINGISASETLINAAIAGHFGVPVIMVSGDAAYCDHVAELLPHAGRVTLKHASGRISGETVTPAEAVRMLKAATKKVLGKVPGAPLFQIQGPVELAIDFKWHHPAEMLDYLPAFRREGAHRVIYAASHLLEAVRVLEFLVHYKPVPD